MQIREGLSHLMSAQRKLLSYTTIGSDATAQIGELIDTVCKLASNRRVLCYPDPIL